MKRFKRVVSIIILLTLLTAYTTAEESGNLIRKLNKEKTKIQNKMHILKENNKNNNKYTNKNYGACPPSVIVQPFVTRAARAVVAAPIVYLAAPAPRGTLFSAVWFAIVINRSL